MLKRRQGTSHNNPYEPSLPTFMSLDMLHVMGNEHRRDIARSRNWEIGHQERLAGLPCRSTNGAYLEGWYA